MGSYEARAAETVLSNFDLSGGHNAVHLIRRQHRRKLRPQGVARAVTQVTGINIAGIGRSRVLPGQCRRPANNKRAYNWMGFRLKFSQNVT